MAATGTRVGGVGAALALLLVTPAASALATQAADPPAPGSSR
ncbi:hypothetical protein [Streptomyces sp. NRRL S-448]